MKHKRLLVATVLMANLVMIALAMQVVNLSAQVEQWRHEGQQVKEQRDAALEVAGRAVGQAGEAASVSGGPDEKPAWTPSVAQGGVASPAQPGLAGNAAATPSGGQAEVDLRTRAADLKVQLRIVRQGDGRMLEPAKHPDILRQLDEML